MKNQVKKQQVKTAEFFMISKLFSNGQVTVKANAKINGSLIKIRWPFNSRDEADRCIDQMYDNPVKIAQRYVMLFRKI
ncbi:hypothetical protein [Wohlfahrtiimonas larvae]|uniref:Uncharacterized protein n=1 Tax=Wohlfahrtiimonas larvae TaxID=1157986 RepID=A0ABP9MSM1_9GAMM|nr:hypothetical protein [Wohlfahrtiimonas larvae]